MGSLRRPQKPAMDDEVYRRFSALIHDETGLSFGPTSQFFLERRLETRMSALGGMTRGITSTFSSTTPTARRNGISS